MNTSTTTAYLAASALFQDRKAELDQYHKNIYRFGVLENLFGKLTNGALPADETRAVYERLLPVLEAAKPGLPITARELKGYRHRFGQLLAHVKERHGLRPKRGFASYCLFAFGFAMLLSLISRLVLLFVPTYYMVSAGFLLGWLTVSLLDRRDAARGRLL